MKNRTASTTTSSFAQLRPARWSRKASFWQLLLCCGLGLALSAQASRLPVTGAASRAGATPEDKVLICHKGHDITVSGNAVDAHLAHGDQIGSCAAVGGGPLRSAAVHKAAPQAR